ncbi:MAG: glycosyl hydrolase [Bacteroidota bacterium]
MRNLQLLCLAILFPLLLSAQQNQPGFTPATERVASYQTRVQLAKKSILRDLSFRSIGPTVMSGRVVDIDINPTDPTEFLVAYASGGLWYTENNGTSFTPIFDQEMVMTLGDIRADWENRTIWAGTGEVNSSRSSYAGVGMYYSPDWGATWQHKGLAESHHIGRILTHPTDPNTLWVAVLGHLYTPNKERGVYRSKDAGTTWERVLFVNDNAGAVDLILDPQDPNILYAAIWERTRRAWNFVESGEGSAIYRSTDGGTNWNNISPKGSGFPAGEGVGRIGLDAVVVDGETVIYAVLDNYFRRDKEEEESQGLTKDDLRNMSREDFLAYEEKDLEDYLKQYRFPKKYNVQKVRELVDLKAIQPNALVEYVEDANSLLFDTPVIGAEVYRSSENATKWTKTHEGYLDQVFNSYGYYFGQIRVHPQNDQLVYIMGVPVVRSTDGGANWENVNKENVHVDHHALWLNPADEGHIILGNDGGINISYDQGEHWIKCNSPAVGQFYAVAVDEAKPYNVYGGLQDNGVWVASSETEVDQSWHNSGQNPYREIMGGDGMQIAVDTRDNNIVYTGYQFGNYFRINKATEQLKRITPKHELGDRPLRWNWQTPVQLSVHNQDILYMGSNKLHRSFNQGDDFEEISPDLTKGGKKGDVAFGTITSFHESNFRFGLIYVGSDDGLVHVTQDGGNTWADISSGLPTDMWISRVQASSHKQSRVYVSLNGYRWDNFETMLYVSEDYGKNWNRLGKELPLEPINVVREDPVNEEILYVGTDHGLYISFDRGATFHLCSDLPATPVHDLAIQKREGEILVGTHGRSLYIGDLKEIQQIDELTFTKALTSFEVGSMKYRGSWGNPWSPWWQQDDPSATLPLFSSLSGKGTMEIKTAKGLTIQTVEADIHKGLNYPTYNLSVDKAQAEAYEKELNADLEEGEEAAELEAAENGLIYIRPGTYTVKLNLNAEVTEWTLTIE